YLLADDVEPSDSFAVNRRIGFGLATFAIALVILAMQSARWGWVMIWPAFSVGVVAAGYLGLGPAVYRKRNGALPWATRAVLAPVLLALWINWRLRRSNVPWHAIAPNVLLSRKLSESDANRAVDEGVIAVLDLTSEFSIVPALRTSSYLN